MKTHAWKVLYKWKTKDIYSGPYKHCSYIIGEITESPSNIGIFCLDTRQHAREYLKEVRDYCEIQRDFVILKVEVDSQDRYDDVGERAAIMKNNDGDLYGMVCYSRVKLTSTRG